MFKRLMPRGFAIAIIFSFLKRFVMDQIKNSEIRSYVQRRTEELRAVTDIYTDNDPNNKLQIAMVWDRYKSRFVADNVELIESELVDDWIHKVKHQQMAQYLRSRWEELEAVARILTDGDPDNAAQIDALWKQHQNRFLRQQVDLAELLIEQKMVDSRKKETLLMILATGEDLLTD